MEMLYIENDGALFRGPARGVPLEVWSEKSGKFEPYKDAGKPRDVAWGTVIDEAEAREFMGGAAPAEGEPSSEEKSSEGA